MSGSPAGTWPRALLAVLRLLAEGSTGAFRPIAGNAPTGTNDVIRALAIIAELRAALGASTTSLPAEWGPKRRRAPRICPKCPSELVAR